MRPKVSFPELGMGLLYFTFKKIPKLTNKIFPRVSITEVSKYRSSLENILLIINIYLVSGTHSKINNNQSCLEKALFGEGTFSIFIIRTHFLRERLEDS